MLTALFFMTVCAQEALPPNNGPLIPLTPNTVRRLSSERPGNPPPPSESCLRQSQGSDLTEAQSRSYGRESLNHLTNPAPTVLRPQPQRPR